jgi:hypothetical protein
MTKPLNISIRPLAKADQPFLREMLHQAVSVPEGAEPLPRTLLSLPEIRRYAEDRGKRGDMGFIALDETGRRPVGAVWTRLLTDENERPRGKPRGIKERNPQEHTRQAAGYSSSRESGIKATGTSTISRRNYPSLLCPNSGVAEWEPDCLSIFYLKRRLYIDLFP